MGEVLHKVDFDQLEIENKQYLEKIDERNQDLLKLKLMAGKTLQVLNSYKVNREELSPLGFDIYIYLCIEKMNMYVPFCWNL